MDSIWIQGGQRLEGEIPISGAKNAALALLPCALLTEDKLTLGNLPRLADVDSFGHLLNQLGVSTMVAGVKKGEIGRRMTLQASEIASTVAPYDMVRKMRASILVLGPMLARAGEATVSLPGGCAIGDRPIDLHLQALEAMGAEIELAAGYVKASAPKGRLIGRRLQLPRGLGRRNRECADGRGAGARPLATVQRRPRARDRRPVQLAGSDGRQDRGHRLEPSDHRRRRGAAWRRLRGHARPDRGRQLRLRGRDHRRIDRPGRSASRDDMLAITNALAQTGLIVEFRDQGIKVSANGKLKPLALSTAPFPGFPTDMQAQFMAMLSMAEGAELPRGNDLRKPLHARARAAPDGRAISRSMAARRWSTASKG